MQSSASWKNQPSVSAKAWPTPCVFSQAWQPLLLTVG
jgi:hypothetical protein